MAIHCALPQPTWEGSHAVQGIDQENKAAKKSLNEIAVDRDFCFGVIEVQDDFKDGLRMDASQSFQTSVS